MLTDKQIKLFKEWYGLEPPECFEVTKNTGLFSNKRFVINVSGYEQINDVIKFIAALMHPSMRIDWSVPTIDFKCNYSRNQTVPHIESVWGSIENMNPREDIINSMYSDDDPNKPVTIPKNEHKSFVTGLIRAAMKRTGVCVEMSFGWRVSGKCTTCEIIHGGVKYSADAKKHPRDPDNEYIGKSLSFKRAYAALVDGINGVKLYGQIGYASHDIKKGSFGAVLIWRHPHLRKAGEDIKRMDSVATGADGCIFKTENMMEYHSNSTIKVNPQKKRLNKDLE